MLLRGSDSRCGSAAGSASAWAVSSARVTCRCSRSRPRTVSGSSWSRVPCGQRRRDPDRHRPVGVPCELAGGQLLRSELRDRLDRAPLQVHGAARVCSSTVGRPAVGPGSLPGSVRCPPTGPAATSPTPGTSTSPPWCSSSRRCDVVRHARREAVPGRRRAEEDRRARDQRAPRGRGLDGDGVGRRVDGGHREVRGRVCGVQHARLGDERGGGLRESVW